MTTTRIGCRRFESHRVGIESRGLPGRNVSIESSRGQRTRLDADAASTAEFRVGLLLERHIVTGLSESSKKYRYRPRIFSLNVICKDETYYKDQYKRKGDSSGFEFTFAGCSSSSKSEYPVCRYR
jgi:hypothetical protein